MNSKTTLPISEVRKKIFEITKKVQIPNNYYTLTENGKPTAVLMSIEDFESMVETINVLQEIPDIRERIKEAEADVRLGRTVPFSDILKKWGYEKSVSARVLAKSGKGS
ncbi:MAG: type II toxin-antitoxin system Phd/YefM family antitoxin [bacterium]